MSTIDRIDAAAALDALDDLFVVFDASGSLIEWNRATTEVTGYSPEKLSAMQPLDFFAAEDIGDVTSALKTVQSEGTVTLEGELVTANSTRIPYEFEVKETTDVAGETVYVCIGRDISERERAHRQREEILDRMSDAFFAVDDDWVVQYANERAERIIQEAMAEESSHDVEGIHLWSAIPDATETAFYERYHEAMDSQEPVSFEEYYEPLDTWFDVRVHPYETGLSVYLFDITEHKEQRQEMAHRQTVLRQMYDIISDRGRSFEDQISALLGLGREELDVKYGTLSRIQGDEYVFEFVDADTDTIKAGDTVPLAATNCEIAASREETLVLGNIERDAPEQTDRAGFAEWGISCYIGSPVYTEGEVYGTFCFYDETPRDGQFSDWEVTLVDMMARWVSYELGRRRSRERLERQNEKLEQFTSIVSHDLRNPLNALEGWLELAEETNDPEQFERCRRTIERMNTLVDDLLELARAGSAIMETESVHLNEVITDCVTAVPLRAESVTIETTQVIQADKSRLKQLIENLLRNTAEHAGPDVTVTVGPLPDGFYVADDGPGIDEDHREQVFESGFSTSEEGTGFGLAIVREIAEGHDWTVTLVESESGGARFEFRNVQVETA